MRSPAQGSPMTRSVADHSADAPFRERTIVRIATPSHSHPTWYRCRWPAGPLSHASLAQTSQSARPKKRNDRSPRLQKKTAQPWTRASALVSSVGGSHENLVRFITRCRRLTFSSRRRRLPGFSCGVHHRTGTSCRSFRLLRHPTCRDHEPPESVSARRMAIDSVLGGLSMAWRNCRGKTIYPAGAQ
jgi:hypothetical protein